jgi:hypothetical protein
MEDMLRPFFVRVLSENPLAIYDCSRQPVVHHAPLAAIHFAGRRIVAQPASGFLNRVLFQLFFFIASTRF